MFPKEIWLEQQSGNELSPRWVCVSLKPLFHSLLEIQLVE